MRPGNGKMIYFIVNLPQDVNMVRGLVYLAARETDARISFLITQAFLKRDRQTIWQREVAVMAAETGAAMYLYAEPSEAYAVLEGGSGMIFAAAESNLPAHREVREAFEIAPPSYLRVTLQHGFECVGFVQSREHVISHGRNISFTADVICGWFESSLLTSLTASQRAKLYVSGPPMLIQSPGRYPEGAFGRGGLICENMHSVRLKASGDHKTSFMDTFFAFCQKMAERDKTVTLRPHPGGQYVLKNNVVLPPNVKLNNLPIFEVNLGAYSFGISAPSTIVFDMVLAGIPVGVWRDPEGVMDAGNYEGLTEISTLDDWLAFERDVRLRPEMIIDRQNAFLSRLAMPTNPKDIYGRFARLIIAGLSRLEARAGVATPGAGTRRSARPIALSGDMLAEVGA